jgi:hypothetical protein
MASIQVSLSDNGLHASCCLHRLMRPLLSQEGAGQVVWNLLPVHIGVHSTQGARTKSFDEQLAGAVARLRVSVDRTPLLGFAVVCETNSTNHSVFAFSWGKLRRTIYVSVTAENVPVSEEKEHDNRTDGPMMGLKRFVNVLNFGVEAAAPSAHVETVKLSDANGAKNRKSQL